MTRHLFLLAAATLLLVTNLAHADVGFPSLGSPDFERSAPADNAFFGLSLATMLIFGGYWIIRGGLAWFCVIGGIFFFLLGLLCLLVFLPIGTPIFSGGGALMAYWGVRKNVLTRAPFVGRNLLFLLISLGALVATIVSLERLTWTNPREERRRQQYEQRQQRQRDAKEKQPTPPAAQDE